MFRINRARIESEAKQKSAKTDRMQGNPSVFDAVKLVFVNLVDEVAKLSVYDATHWACNVDRWIDNLQSENRTTYTRGEIVFLDLGAQNFRYEPSYTHACIVLANRKSSILIVPCSTKKFGSGHSDIIDATPADGFRANTGIQSESFRWVNKNRVVSRTGKKVSPSILDKLDQVLISFAPSNILKLKRLNGEIERLAARIAELEAEKNDSTKDKKVKNEVDNSPHKC